MKKIVFGLAILLCILPFAFAQEETPESDDVTKDEVTVQTESAESSTTSEVVTGREQTNSVAKEQTSSKVESDDKNSRDTNNAAAEKAQDEKEIAVIRYQHGAKVRMMQLKYSVLSNILVGEEVVKYIQEKYPNTSVAKLNDILDKLQLIADEIDSVDYNRTAEDLAKQYVDLKNESRALAKEFRDEVRLIITPEDRNELAKRIREKTKEELKNLHEQIRHLVREFNAERFESAMKRIGREKPDVTDMIRRGVLQSQQIAQQVREGFQNLSDEEKKQAVNRIREEAAKARVYKEAAMAQIMSNQQERLSTRLQQRSEELARLAERFQERNMTRVSEALMERSAVLEQKSGIAGVRSERLNNLSQRIKDGVDLPERQPKPQMSGEVSE